VILELESAHQSVWMPRDSGIVTTKLAITSPTDFSNAAWSKFAVTVAADQESDPFGGTTADLITDTISGVATHALQQTVTGMTGQTTISLLAKAGSLSWVLLMGNGGGVGGWFDLGNGVAGTQSGVTGSIRAFGGGWYFCSIALTASTGVSQVYLTTGNGVATHVGTGTGTVRLYSMIAYSYGRSFSASELTLWHARSHVAGVV